MLTYVYGDIFRSPAQTLVNAVNTVGVMGKGIALEYKRAFPDMFREYQELCESGRFKVGTLHLFMTPNKWVINFPTKDDWRRPSKLEYIEEGLSTFVQMYQTAKIESIAFPLLGCGNGELDWASEVRPVMEKFLRDLPIQVYIYPRKAPSTPAEHKTPNTTVEWLRSQPESLGFTEVWHDLTVLLASRTEFSTLSKGSPFEASMTTDPPQIRIRAAGKSYPIEHDAVFLVWQGLRRAGILSGARLPDAFRSTYLFPVLAELPYITPIVIAPEAEDLEIKPTQALQLVPPAAGSQSQLQLM